VARLEAAINRKDKAEVEEALDDVQDAGVDLGRCTKLQAGMCSLLIGLLNASWHAKHEVVVACIAAFRCAEAVPALERLSTSGNAVIARYAAWHLRRWQHELGCTGN
jgi:hypothetical protein